MIQIIKNPKYNFIGYRKITYVISALLIVMALVSLIMKGINYGIEFTGGSMVKLHFEQPVQINELRDKVAQLGFKEAVIQEEKGTNNYIIKTTPKEGIGVEISKLFTPQPSIEQEELFGPSVSEGFRRKALLVVALSCILMLIYIWIRFTFRWGICAVISLIHDVFITTGIIVLMGKEFTVSILAALLTIIGYSINDTVVVSDRVREDLRLNRRTPLPELINGAINETLSRTLLTGLSTIFMLVILFFIGGPVIHDFVLTLLIGVIIGTYSTIFVVAALMVDWGKLTLVQKR